MTKTPDRIDPAAAELHDAIMKLRAMSPDMSPTQYHNTLDIIMANYSPETLDLVADYFAIRARINFSQSVI